jgi:hypothetical protein
VHQELGLSAKFEHFSCQSVSFSGRERIFDQLCCGCFKLVK